MLVGLEAWKPGWDEATAAAGAAFEAADDRNSPCQLDIDILIITHYWFCSELDVRSRSNPSWV